MITVAQLVEDIAEVMKETPESVNAYARALIDSGDLPKSRGRAIAHVGIPDIVKLVMAVAMQPKIKDASETVAAYFDMMGPGVMKNFPESLTKRTAGSEICDLVEIIFSRTESDDDKSFRKELLDATITITLNWPEIELRFSGSKLIRFKTGGNPDLWEGYHRRAVILSGRVFLMLGVGTGRNYKELAD